MMMIYIKIETSTLYEIEALLYVQEAQLDKYRQELSITNVTKNMVHVEENHTLKNTKGGYQHSQGRGHTNKGRFLEKLKQTPLFEIT